MPTRKSLNDSWITQFTLGLSDEQYYCNDHSPEPVNERNYKPKENPLEEFTGERLGTVEYNHLTKEISIKIDGPEKD
jgi:hypothetical protein